tara:strand:- start:1761 stop:2732 length:972 start_codon:yes stop_codon:yes gene_type:complete
MYINKQERNWMLVEKIKMGIIGLGHLGKYHLNHLAVFQEIEIVGIYDVDIQLTQQLALKYDVPKADSINELLDSADAVSIVTPTNTHAEIACQALEKNCHVFIEKPITNSIDAAHKIKEYIAKRIIHVGHIERFNPAFIAFMEKKHNPLFLECHRLTKINSRSMDISVVLDLMIHDIDLLINMIKSPIQEIIADGISVISNNIDLANVKLIFKNGCVANLTASRISNKNMRKIRVFENQTYTSIDLYNKEVLEFSAQGNIETNKLKFDNKEIEVNKEEDALVAELKHFCNAIKNKDYDASNVNAAIDALAIALQINKIIHEKK